MSALLFSPLCLWVRVGVLSVVWGRMEGPSPVLNRHLFSEERLLTGRMDSMEVTAASDALTQLKDFCLLSAVISVPPDCGQTLPETAPQGNAQPQSCSLCACPRAINF